jgi:hypothetical protein
MKTPHLDPFPGARAVPGSRQPATAKERPDLFWVAAYATPLRAGDGSRSAQIICSSRA